MRTFSSSFSLLDPPRLTFVCPLSQEKDLSDLITTFTEELSKYGEAQDTAFDLEKLFDVKLLKRCIR